MHLRNCERIDGLMSGGHHTAQLSAPRYPMKEPLFALSNDTTDCDTLAPAAAAAAAILDLHLRSVSIFEVKP
jgi:hypothetical protein